MTTKERALGKLFDLSMAVEVQDLDGSTTLATGKRINMKNAAVCTFVVMKDASATDDLAVDLKQYRTKDGADGIDLDIITEFFVKEETTLDGDEAWTRVTQAAASEIAARADSAEKECLWVIEVRADQLAEGYSYVALDIPDLGSAAAQWGCALAILSGLKVEAKPEHLPVIFQ